MKIVVHTEKAVNGRVQGTLTMFGDDGVVMFIQEFDIPEEWAKTLKCEWDKP